MNVIHTHTPAYVYVYYKLKIKNEIKRQFVDIYASVRFYLLFVFVINTRP